MNIGLFSPTAHGGRQQLLRVLVVLALLLLLLVKGSRGNGLPQALRETGAGQVFESSLARGRYALVLSLVEYGSTVFPRPVADFAAPDVAFAGPGRFVSLFQPGVAFLAVPFYVIGRFLSAGQIAVMLLPVLQTLALLTVAYAVCRSLFSSAAAALLASAALILGTPVLPYATQLVQHQTAMLIVLGLVWLCREPMKGLRFFAVCLLAAASLLFDWPNMILVAPFVAYAGIGLLTQKGELTLSGIVRDGMYLVTAVGIPLAGFTLYNKVANGNPYQTTQFAPPVTAFSSVWGWLIGWITNSFVSAFSVPRIPAGLWVLLVSWERGLVWFAPVLLWALAGVPLLVRRRRGLTVTMIVSMVATVLFYSMFGDVWGGPAFGPRYLLPVLALAVPFLAAAVSHYKDNRWFAGLSSLTLLWSIGVNVLGAVTTIALPGGQQGTAGGLEVAAEFLTNGTPGSFLFREGLGLVMSGPVFFGINLALCLVLVWPLWRQVFRRAV